MTRMTRSFALTLPLMIALAGGAWAEDHDHDQHAGHDHGTGTPAASESTKAFEEANARMHRDMTASYTGDADVDFVQGMIPHHQGAIDMAGIVLKYETDPETRRLAEEVIKAQTAEIALMKAWLAKHGR